MKPLTEMQFTELLAIYHEFYDKIKSDLWQMVALGFGHNGDVYFAAAREDLSNIEQIRAEITRRENLYNIERIRTELKDCMEGKIE